MIEKLKSVRWPSYRVCGVTLASDFPFATTLDPVTATPDLLFHSVIPSRLDNLSATERLSYQSPVLTRDGKPAIMLYRAPGVDRIHFPDFGDYFVLEREIIADSSLWMRRHEAEFNFLSTVLPYYLERDGATSLHASACAFDGRAIAFLGAPSAGKSTLVAGLVGFGLEFLADDRLTIRIASGTPYASQSYPTIRLNEMAARHLFGNPSNRQRIAPHLPKVLVPIGEGGIGDYCKTAVPLDTIYLLTRRQPADPDQRVRIEPIPAHEAVMSMIRHSSLPRLVHALGWHVDRFDRLIGLSHLLHFRRLIYPHGFHYFRPIYESLLKDLQRD